MADDLYVLGLGIDSGGLALAGRNVESTLTRIVAGGKAAQGSLAGVASAIGGTGFFGPVITSGTGAARAIEEVGAASTRTERAASRLSFGLSRIATTGMQGGLGLRSVETGLMTLVPGLGWGLVAVTALVEGVEILSRKSDEADKEWEKLTASFRVDAPISMQRTKTQQLADAMGNLNAKIAEADALAARPLGGSLAGSFIAGLIGKDPDKLREQLEALNDELRLNEIRTGHGSRDEVAKRSSDALKEETKALTDQLAKLSMTTGEWAAYEAAQKGVNATGQRTVKTLADELGAWEAYHRAVTKQAQDAARERTEAARKASEDADRAMREAVDEQRRTLEEGERNLQRSFDRQQSLARRQAEEMKGLFGRVASELSSGRIGGALEAVGQYAVGRLFREPEEEVAAAGPTLPPVRASAIERAMDAARRKRALDALFATPPEPIAPLTFPELGRGHQGHTFQIHQENHLSSIGPRDSFDLFQLHGPLLAKLAVQGISRDPDLLSALTGPGQ